MRKLLVRFAIAAGALCVLAMVTVLALLFLAGRAIREKTEPPIRAFAEQSRRALEPILEQRKALAADPFFHQSRSKKDAGPFLNPRLEWRGAGGHKAPDDLVILDAEVKALLQPLGNDWATKGFDLQIPAEFDTGWMRWLREYGYWELGEHSPLAEQASFTTENEPTPDWSAFKSWAKLRLLEGMRSGELEEAVKDVRQLAWLCHSTETLVGNAVAQSLLELEQPAYEAQRGAVRPLGDWQPMDPKSVHSLRQVVEGLSALASIAAPEDVRRHALAAGADDLGRCAALSEAENTAALMEKFGKGERAEYFDWLDKSMAEPGGCRFHWARAMRSKLRIDPKVMGQRAQAENEVGRNAGLGGTLAIWFARDYLDRWTRDILVSLALPTKSLDPFAPPMERH